MIARRLHFVNFMSFLLNYCYCYYTIVIIFIISLAYINALLSLYSKKIYSTKKIVRGVMREGNSCLSKALALCPNRKSYN
jgi:hypothetical protein